MITQVMVFFMEIPKETTAAYTKKPTAMGGMNLKICSKSFLSTYSMRNENAPIKIDAGRIQIIRVKTASHTPPLLYPINVIVWVDEAPGKS
jgi:hypothetical protein